MTKIPIKNIFAVFYVFFACFKTVFYASVLKHVLKHSHPGPGPTDFYIPSSLAKETPLTNEREKLAYTEALAEKQEKQTFAKNFA